jgi:hypothetical protein
MGQRAAKLREKGKPVPQWTDELAFLNDPAFNPVIAWLILCLIAARLPTERPVFFLSLRKSLKFYRYSLIHHRDRPGKRSRPARQTDAYLNTGGKDSGTAGL